MGGITTTKSLASHQVLGLIICALLTMVSYAAAEPDARAKSSSVRQNVQPAIETPSPRGVIKRRFPIAIPPASEVLQYRREHRTSPPPPRKKEAKAESTVLGRLLELKVPVGTVAGTCNRAIPTRNEFLIMLKTRPADAHQILLKCSLDVRSISPLRQLPVGIRQLPEDTRRRPVDTWPR